MASLDDIETAPTIGWRVFQGAGRLREPAPRLGSGTHRTRATMARGAPT